MAVRVFTTPAFRALDPVLRKRLSDEFRVYVESGELPISFGRDEPYDLIPSIRATGLRHIHIRDKTSKRWHLRTMQFNRKSDTALVYCQGYKNPDHYLLIAFFENAHVVARDLLYIMKLGDIADDFRNKF